VKAYDKKSQSGQMTQEEQSTEEATSFLERVGCISGFEEGISVGIEIDA
jgi:hypothetical protein